eukprot:CAMPEP_0178910086 /NCGR_PEP_ID=MMETSP0786-20121207/8900_1 /TAXON_ID=186022 /ORGANISM="Thalassionema frauenfeldii, Strain CCMP 1798" /LENGTH=529 /DNA_ID=CAMNT_0020582295 /DNA_START=35 /DNA_END=1624 /DNA_ORIENTATION=+
MSYKNNADANRDALFSPSSRSKSGPKHKRDNKANRDALFGGLEKGNETKKTSRKSSSSSGRPTPSSTSTAKKMLSTAANTRGYTHKAKPKVTSTLSGTAKMEKLKEAESFRDKATKAMQRGVFTRPDPVMAGNYYKRAADAYGLCGENRLERLHRVASADCQMGSGGYSAAAAEYMKAGALVKETNEEINLDRKRKEGWKFYSDAASAWEKANEPGKAANCRVLSAVAWTWEEETTLLDKQALTSLEEAVEAHVPDVLNNYSLYRQTGVSKFVDPSDKDAKPSKQTLILAMEHLVKTPYAHESVQELIDTFVRFGEYRSALYACGAVSCMLENDGVSTLTLSRSYVMETILALSMGDPVTAERQFLDRHVQKTHYLSSRECKLAEDLFRAVLSRDSDALNEARSPTGSNKNGLASLHASMRDLVQNLRVSGAARKKRPTSEPATEIQPTTEIKPASEPSAEEKSKGLKLENVDKAEEIKPKDKDSDDKKLDSKKLENELDTVMADLDGIDFGEKEEDDDNDDDDDIDLR